MKTFFVTAALLAKLSSPALCQQANPGGYPTGAPPSAMDYAAGYQRLEMQHQQILLQRQQMQLQQLQIERQRLDLERQTPDMHRQLKFERQQAEAYQLRQIERARAKSAPKPSQVDQSGHAR
ncbi:hypothetical protein V1282_003534 [Nitrobacteraceae bacterium AZCC 2146]